MMTTSKKRRSAKQKAITCLKAMSWVVLIHGLLCITDSHLLAWMGRVETLESLSSTQTTEIVAPILVYGFTKTIENIFEKNKIFKSKEEEETWNG